MSAIRDPEFQPQSANASSRHSGEVIAKRTELRKALGWGWLSAKDWLKPTVVEFGLRKKALLVL
jgi:hypothetical protein